MVLSLSTARIPPLVSKHVTARKYLTGFMCDVARTFLSVYVLSIGSYSNTGFHYQYDSQVYNGFHLEYG
jgi:hypothetical protein